MTAPDDELFALVKQSMDTGWRPPEPPRRLRRLAQALYNGGASVVVGTSFLVYFTLSGITAVALVLTAVYLVRAAMP